MGKFKELLLGTSGVGKCMYLVNSKIRSHTKAMGGGGAEALLPCSTQSSRGGHLCSTHYLGSQIFLQQAQEGMAYVRSLGFRLNP